MSFWKYLISTAFRPASVFCSLQSTRIFSWLVPEATAIVFPATSSGAFTFQPEPFLASKARLSSR